MKTSIISIFLVILVFLNPDSKTIRLNIKIKELKLNSESVELQNFLFLNVIDSMHEEHEDVIMESHRHIDSIIKQSKRKFARVDKTNFISQNKSAE